MVTGSVICWCRVWFTNVTNEVHFLAYVAVVVGDIDAVMSLRDVCCSSLAVDVLECGMVVNASHNSLGVSWIPVFGR